MQRLVVFFLLMLISAGAMAKSLPVNQRLGGDFELPSTLGKNTSLSQFKGKVVLLNFGYTSCPDICPMVVARMAQVLKRLGQDKQQVQALFVTFDPARDSVAQLKAYLEFFDPSIVGFSGTEEQVRKVASQYGVIYMPTEAQSAAGTLYSHSDFIYLLDRQGRVRALFATDKPLAEMVDDVRSLLAEE